MLKVWEKKALHGNILEFVLLHTLKTRFSGEHLTQRWTQLGPFLQHQSTFFDFQKRAEEASLVPYSCAPLLLAAPIQIRIF